MNPKKKTGPLGLAYDITDWQRLLFERRSKSVPTLRSSVARLGSKIADAKGTEDLGSAGTHARMFGSELFARLYDDPAKIENPSTEAGWSVAAHDAVDQIPEFAELAESVDGDPDFSALATASILQAVGDKVAEAFKAAEEKEEPEAGEITAGDRLRSALRIAVAKAATEVAETKEALAGLSPGSENAPPAHLANDDRRAKLIEAVRSNRQVQDVVRKAGRITRLSAAKKRVRDTNARSEVVDIERGNDLSRALPGSLARLKHPKLRLLALRDIVERQMPQYRLEGREVLGRGPLVVLLDESGSMSGDAIGWARALGLAAIAIGAKEKRTVSVASFQETITNAQRVEASGRAFELDVIKAAQGPEIEGGRTEVALRLASRGTGGGTDFTHPLLWALEAGALDDRADLVFVTDGLASASEGTLEKLREAKTRGVRVYALTVRGGSLSPAIRAIADEAVDLDKVPDVGAALAKASP